MFGLGNIGPLEIFIVLVIALIVFGPKRLPELGSSLGRGIREFRDTITGVKGDGEDVKALSATKAAALAPEPAQPAEPEAVADERD
jgi:sec-independent protein translocase protein TatA